MRFLTDLFSGGAGKLVDSVGGVLDNLITSKEEVMQQDLELKKAEMQYQLELRRQGVEETKAFLADTDSARKRNAEVETSANASWLSKNISSFLAIFTTLLTFILFYIVIFRNDSINTDMKDVVVYLLGVLSTILTQVFSFYFGSSQNKEKPGVAEAMAGKK